MGNGYLTSCALVISIIMFIVFTLKDKISNIETKIFGSMLLINILESICTTLIVIIAITINSNIILIILNKLDIILIISWISFMYFYVCNITKNNNKINGWKTILVINSILIIGCIFSKVNIINENGILNSNGPATNIALVGSIIYIVLILIKMLITKKEKFKQNSKKYIPIYILIFLLVVLALARLIIPEINLISIILSIIGLIMYFTIENPDVKMLEVVSIAKETAEKANNAKTDFLSNMSHEIRTPLNAIVGFSESLKEDDIPDTAREKVNDIITASNNLLEIVNGILDISKIEANKLEIINKEYDIKSMLDELVSLTKARIGDKGLDFRVSIDESIPRVLYGDNTRIKQIILNILTNAVKYTKEGYVDFTVSTVIKDNICRLIISVEDSGIGIKEESLPKLFSKFERLDVEKQVTIEGTGLGLAITKKLIELMNGKIIVQSIYGKGSKFTVSIDQRIIAVEPTKTKVAKSESKIVDAKGARILIVDDNELNIKVASVLLKKYNFNIDSCTSGLACLAKINNDEKYDIIFLDDMMPKLSGRETLKRLRKIENFNTPVIALTANAITGMREEYLASGFDDYLSKPIEKLELERVIKEYISKNNSSDANTTLHNAPSSILEDKITIEESPTNNIKDYTNKKVLLVDDNELNLKVAINSLKKYNLDITTSTSGSDSIVKVIENKYDIILLDDMMPELDGCKTIDNYHELEEFNTPVVMMTASSEDEVKDKLKEHKFNGYLSKPFKQEELEKLLDSLLNK